MAYWVSSKSHDRVTKGNCNCPSCRRKAKFDKKRKVKEFSLQDVPLFCKVFPEGIIGDCGFRYFGFCSVFEDNCVRWNELGDKKDYSVGRPNPFEGGE
jgi:C4-type Zn-finger protein